jgi:hypothetical protein
MRRDPAKCDHLHVTEIAQTVEETQKLRMLIIHLECLDCGISFGRVLKQEALA